jgi:hypothetical protein
MYYTLTHLRDRIRFRFVLREASWGGVRGIAVAGYNLDGSEESFPEEVLPGDGSRVSDYFVVQKISDFGTGGASVFRRRPGHRRADLAELNGVKLTTTGAQEASR